jgi:release factor glutamine methyltransferase
LGLENRTTAYLVANLHQRLSSVSETPGLDAQVLLAHILEKSRAWVLAHPEAVLTPAQERLLMESQARLEQGEPLPYVLGRWEFYGLDFIVNPNVLIPRPETELMVEHALAWLETAPQRHLVLDAGTGSGCIAIALAVHAPALRVVASDISLAALKTASVNAARHAVSSHVMCVQSHLIPAIAQPFNLICANLPYIPAEKLDELIVAEREPRLALDGGPDGLSLIRELLASASGSLARNGLLLIEIEASQGSTAWSLAKAAFPQADVTLLPDLAGRDRLVKVLKFSE